MKCLKVILLFLFPILLHSRSTTSIRVLNSSKYDFKKVMIDDKSYGDIKSNQYTGYQNFDLAYSYSYVELVIDDKVFKLQPIDYVGETPLGSGRFTYVLTVRDFTRRRLDQATTRDP